MGSLAVASPEPEFAANSEQWEGSTCEFLILRVLRKEHADLRAAIRSVRTLAKLVGEREEPKQAELTTVGDLIEDLAAELAAHMLAEEHAVFPVLLDLELAYVGEGPISMPARRIEPLLRNMSQQHSATGRTLTRIHHESNGYHPPAGAGVEYKQLYEQMATLDAELRRDVRLEDSVLFRRATQIERELLRGGPVRGRQQIA
jgi:regulator of cell morphogenesis and NO signaling